MCHCMSCIAWPEMTLADSCALPTCMSLSGTDTHPQDFAAETHLTLDTVTRYIKLPSAVAFLVELACACQAAVVTLQCMSRY